MCDRGTTAHNHRDHERVDPNRVAEVRFPDLKFSQIVENVRTVHGTVGLVGGIQGDPIRRDVGGVEPEVPLVRVEKLLAVPSEIQTG